MTSVRELKVILKENKVHFFAYWSKKRLLVLVNEHDLLPKKAPEREKSKDPKYNRLKTIMQNPRKVSQEDIETGEIKKISIDFQSGKIYRSIAYDGSLLGTEGKSLEE